MISRRKQKILSIEYQFYEVIIDLNDSIIIYIRVISLISVYAVIISYSKNSHRKVLIKINIGVATRVTIPCFNTLG